MRLEIKPINLVKGLIEGMVYLHKQVEIVHGNLTPQNILINEEGEAVVADPLLFKKFRNKIVQSPRKESEIEKDAKDTKDKEPKSNTISSAKKHIGECYKAQVWNAPEIILQELPYNQEKPTQKSDIFSLGLLIFYIISYGEHAFAHADIVHTSSMVKENILNNNYSFKVRQNFLEIYNKKRRQDGQESQDDNDYKSIDSDDSFNDSETLHFENLDIDERIFMERKYDLPHNLIELLRNLLHRDEECRSKISAVWSKFEVVADFSDFL